MTFVFKHPKYYKELKEFGKRGDRGKPTAASPDTDQAISARETADDARATGPGLKLQAREDSTANSTRGRVAEPQASSVKPQAPEASSGKHQAPSNKRQA